MPAITPEAAVQRYWQQAKDHEQAGRLDAAVLALRCLVTLDEAHVDGWAGLGRLLDDGPEADIARARAAFLAHSGADPDADPGADTGAGGGTNTGAGPGAGKGAGRGRATGDDRSGFDRLLDLTVPPEADGSGHAYERAEALRLEEAGRHGAAAEIWEALIDADPEDAAAHLALAQLYADRLDQPGRALPHVQAVLALDDTQEEAWAYLGYLQHRLGEDAHGALAALDRAILLDGALDMAWAWRGLVLADGLGRRDEAIASYTRALQISPTYAWAWSQLALLLQDEEQGSPEAAVMCLAQMVQALPDDAWAWGHYGALLAQSDDQREQAVAALRRAVALAGDDAWSWAQLGDVLRQLPGGATEGEAALREALRLRPDSGWIHALLGRFYLETADRPDMAVDCFRQAVKLEPGYHYARQQLAHLLHEYDLDHEQALELYRAALADDPASTWLWCQLGHLLHYKLHRPAEAHDAFAEAVRLNPQDGWAWARLAHTLDRLDRTEAAQVAYQRASALEPDNLATLVNHAALLNRLPGQAAQAETLARQALALDAADSGALVQLGRALHDQDDRSEAAAQAYLAALAADDRNGEAWALLALLREERLADPGAALHAYRRAVIAAPGLVWAWRRIAALQLTVHDDATAAAEALHAGLEQQPDDGASLLELGLLQRDRLGRPDLARATFEALLACEPANAGGWLALGDCLVALDLRGDAAAAFAQAGLCGADGAIVARALARLDDDRTNRKDGMTGAGGLPGAGGMAAAAGTTRRGNADGSRARAARRRSGRPNAR